VPTTTTRTTKQRQPSPAAAAAASSLATMTALGRLRRLPLRFGQMEPQEDRPRIIERKISTQHDPFARTARHLWPAEPLELEPPFALVEAGGDARGATSSLAGECCARGKAPAGILHSRLPDWSQFQEASWRQHFPPPPAKRARLPPKLQWAGSESGAAAR